MLRHPVITRFAPSPSGPMHVGHLLAALSARHLADLHGGRCVLRIEDIDPRAQDPRWLALMQQDLEWLGLHFDGDVMVQSRRFGLYEATLHRLRAQGLIYPCFCTRGAIRAQLRELGRAPHATLGDIYPGTCRNLPPELVEERLAAGEPHSWRLNMQRVQDLIGCPFWHDLRRGTQRCVPHHPRPPSGYNPKRRPDFSGGGWSHCSAGHPSGADEPRGNLPELYRDPTAG